jgi:hypothetical protein
LTARTQKPASSPLPESRQMSFAHFVDLLFSFQRPKHLRDLRTSSPVASGAVFLLQCCRTVKKNFEEFFTRSVPPSACCFRQRGALSSSAFLLRQPKNFTSVSGSPSVGISVRRGRCI